VSDRNLLIVTAEKIAKVVSGGQTGVDRAALDAARAAGIAYGGWCPRGGWAEDHATAPGILSRYPDLRETPSSDPDQRTALNVRDSDATLILTRVRPDVDSPGTKLTVDSSVRLGRPLMSIDLAEESNPESILKLVRTLPDRLTLNVAGPRESEAVGIYDQALALLRRTFTGSLAE
jgi:Circularly permutated YpsA SLOG family